MRILTTIPINKQIRQALISFMLVFLYGVTYSQNCTITPFGFTCSSNQYLSVLASYNNGFDYNLTKEGVSFWIAYDQSGGQLTNGCSGSFITTTDLQNDKIYFLTAYHCIHDEINTISNGTIDLKLYIDYESDPSISTPNCIVVPATLVSYKFTPVLPFQQNLDYALFEIDASVLSGVNIVLNGWDSKEAIPSEYYSVHHPQAHPKKLAFSTSANGITSGTHQINNLPFNLNFKTGSFFKLGFLYGRVDAGSSGSPLFNSDDRIIGLYTGHNINPCDYFVYFQKFSECWEPSSNVNKQLKHWLDPDASNMIRFDAIDPFNCSKHFESNSNGSNNNIAGAPVVFDDISIGFTGFTTSYIHSATDKDYFKLNLTQAGNLELTLTDLSNVGQDYNLELYDANGLLALSTNSGTVDDVINYSFSNPSTVYFKVVPANGATGACVPYKVEVSYTGCSENIYEVGNTYTSAYNLNPPFSTSPSTRNVQSIISSSTDKDYYEIGVDHNGIIEIGLYNIPSNYDLRLLDINGAEIASSQLPGSISEAIVFDYSTPASTILYVEVSPATTIYDECEPYELEIDWTPYSGSGCVPILAFTSSTSETAIGANNGTASVSVITGTGTAPFSYLWSNGGTTNTITGLTTGVYSVTVTGADGCTKTLTTTVDGCSGLAVNNLPCCAEFVPVDMTCNYIPSNLTPNHSNSGLTIPACDAPGTIDIWYKFVVPPSGVVNFSSRVVGSTLDDIGAAFYSGTCSNLSEVICLKNSLPDVNSYMPDTTNINLSAHIGDTLFLRMWEFGNGNIIHAGPFDFCISETNVICDNTIIEIFESINVTTATKLNEDNLVESESKLVQWRAVAQQDIPNAVLGLYYEGIDISKQVISVNAGDTLCVCPPINLNTFPGLDTGRIGSFRLLIEQNTSDLTKISAQSALICKENVRIYTRQIQVDTLSDIIHSNGDTLNFTIRKNIQEPVELWVQNLGTLDSFLVTLSLDFDSVSYNTPFGSCTQSWVIPQNLPEGAYQAKAKGTMHPEVFGRGAFFIIGGCVNPFIALDQESIIALDVLCFIGLIDSIQDSLNLVNGYIPVGEATPLTFDALYFLNPNLGQSLPTDSFPVPCGNLQSENTLNDHYYHEARALSYLNYNNYDPGVPRNWFYFPDTAYLTRALAVRILMESFDVLTPDFMGTSPYPDVGVNHPYVKWIAHASDIGLISTASGVNFMPDAPITYEEFYVLLFRLITNYNINVYIPFHNVQRSDYYTPGNYSLESMPYQLGKTDGVYNQSGSTPFAIPGKGMTLSFSFNYSSAEYDFPLEFYRNPDNGDGYDFQILGKGWTHNYDSRVFHFEDEIAGNERYVFVWPGNQVLSYDPNNAVQPFDASSIYDDVSFLPSGNIQVETKTFIKYIFEPVSGHNYYVLKNIIDKFNNVVTLTYAAPTSDGFTKLLSVSESNNPARQINYNYSATNPRKLQSVSENVLNRTVNFSVADNKLNTYEDAMNSAVQYEYQATNGQWNHLMTKVTLPDGQDGEIIYSGNKLDKYKVGTHYFVDYAWQATYSGNNPDEYTQCTVTSAANISSTVVKDSKGRMRSYSSPISDIVINDFGSGNNSMLPTEWSNNDIVYEADYNGKGNLTRSEKRNTSGSLSIESHMTYTANDRLLETYEDPEGHEYTYYYTNNALQKIELPNNGEYEITVRNSTGQVEEVKSPLGITVQYDYNQNTGYLEHVKNVSIPVPGGAQTSILPDPIGRTLLLTDPNGNNAFYTYNDLSQNETIQNQIGEVTSTTYNGNHQATNVSSSKGSTTIGYTSEEAYAASIEFGNDQISVLYAADGLPSQLSKGHYQAVFDYDPQTRQMIKSPGNTYEYNSRFLVKKISNSFHGTTLEFLYDELNRIVEVTSKVGNKTKKVGYEYDDNNNVIKIYYGGLNSSNIVEYDYDDLNRCENVYDWTSSTPLVSYQYDADSKLLWEYNRNGTKTQYIYDNGGRLTGIVNRLSNNTVICSNYFVLDNAGLHTQETISVPGSDAASPQYTFSSSQYGPSPYNQTTSFVNNGIYNAKGFNTAGQVKFVGPLSFDWDMNDKLKVVRNAGSVKAEYKYDGLDFRRWKKIDDLQNFPTVDEVFYNIDIYGMGNVLSEEIIHTNGNTDMIYFIHSPNGMVARLIGNATEYFHYDYRGSVLAMTNQNQVITACYNYDQEGLITHSQGQNYHDQYPNFYTYVGKWGVQQDVEKLYYMRARYMLQPLGRFLTQDPVWSTNLYPYANNDAMNFIDPDGNEFSVPKFDRDFKLKFSKLLIEIIKTHATGTGFTNQYNNSAKSLEEFRIEFEGDQFDDLIGGDGLDIPIIGKNYPNMLKNEDYMFITLSNGRELDLKHFLVAGSKGSYLKGYGMEGLQLMKLSDSAFYPQDLYSNRLGIKFFRKYRKAIQLHPENISGFIYEFLSDPKNL